MPNWTNVAPESDPHLSMRLIRTPTGKPLVACVTSYQIAGCHTHFIQNRTVPCEETDACPHCKKGHTSRWHAWLGAMLYDGLEHFIFECPKEASKTFTAYESTHGTLRGCAFKAFRANARPNGKVIIHCHPADVRKLHLPDAPNVREILCHIWNIPYTDVHVEPKRDNAGPVLVVAPGNGDGRYR